MRRIYYIGAVVLLVAFLVLPALPGMRRASFSSTKAFSIDGKTFMIDPSGGDIHSIIRGKLQQQGLNVPDLDLHMNDKGIFAEGLREIAISAASGETALPHGLNPEHTMRADSDSGQVELAFGAVENSGPQIRRRMTDSGWECVEAAPGRSMLTKNRKGKDMTIVLLEEKEGRFLFIRRIE